ncbi:MAG: preprotein translocase subunit YajC [Oscillospiraceae bacterium]|nr:preprotein translocase subunit YajC [Ruminococcus sp.]MBQ7003182.1 preprotein translocase subunit YajC [Oscillospiraceae bacterium]MBQ7013780.1 preprotein translocase subunit YajC [Oscillospiraceae bacterium]
MSSLTVFAEEASGAAAEEPGAMMTLISTIALPLLMLAFLYFIMIRPQQKADKQAREMLKNIQVGDEVVSIGGIVGIVMRVEEATDTVVLETGGDRLKIRLKRDAIKEDITLNEAAEAEKAAKKKARMTPKSE